MPLDHAVDQAVLDRLVGLEEAVALHVGVDLLDALAGVVGVDLIDPGADVEDLAGVDLDVGRLSSKPADGWWIRMRLLGSEKRLPLVPAVSNIDPIDIATPMQIVCTSGLMNCIVS